MPALNVDFVSEREKQEVALRLVKVIKRKKDYNREACLCVLNTAIPTLDSEIANMIVEHVLKD